MKRLLFIFLMLFTSYKLQAQKYIFYNISLNRNTSYRIGNSVSTVNANIGQEFSLNLELLKDKKKQLKNQHGLIFNLSTITNFENSYKIGLYYSDNFGFNYDEESENKIGLTSYFGPYLRLRLNQDFEEVTFDPFYGLELGTGLQFKMFNLVKAKVMFTSSLDLNLFSDFNLEGRFYRGISFTISVPINKINGISLKQRKQLFKKEEYRRL